MLKIIYSRFMSEIKSYICTEPRRLRLISDDIGNNIRRKAEYYKIQGRILLEFPSLSYRKAHGFS